MNKYCVRYWKTVKTRFGYCSEFSPEELTKDTFANGQKLSLSLVMGYDQNDTSIGWYYFLSGQSCLTQLISTGNKPKLMLFRNDALLH